MTVGKVHDVEVISDTGSVAAIRAVPKSSRELRIWQEGNGILTR